MQLDMFAYMHEPYKITKKIRLIELFAGIGAQSKALERLGVDFEHYRICEYDGYAIKSYNAIHGTNFKTSDITKISAKDLGIVETDKYEYILTYSFPCQDLSLAGNRKGMRKGDSTRSGLLWEVERLLEECKELPQLLLLENVPQVIGQNNVFDFNYWQRKLEQLGYTNYFKILNAKDYGIPQNRNRCFMISVLGEYYYQFPHKRKLKLRLKDMLEEQVDEKYYLSDKAIQGIYNTKFQCSKLESRIEKDGIMPTLCARDYKDPKLVKVAQLDGFESDGRIYDSNGVSPTALAGCQRSPKIIIPEATKKGYVEAHEGDGVYINRPQQKRGVVQKGMIQTIKTQSDDIGVVVKDTRNLKEKLADDLIERGTVKGGEIINHSYTNSAKKPNSRIELEDFIETKDGIMPTLTTRPDVLGVVTSTPLRIRKLTPKECWRLMGFDDEDFEKASKVNSNAQLYKQAGNSIVVNVLEAIFKELI